MHPVEQMQICVAILIHFQLLTAAGAKEVAASVGTRDLAAVQAYVAVAQSSDFAISEQVRPVTCRVPVPSVRSVCAFLVIMIVIG